MIILLLSKGSTSIVAAQEPRFQINLGIAKRYTAIALENTPFVLVTEIRDFNGITHFRSWNATLDFTALLGKGKFELSSNNYIRHNHNHYQRDVNLTSRTEVKKVKTDHLLSLAYLRRSKKIPDFMWMAGAGFGIMNLNSGYDYQHIYSFDSTGAPLTIRVKGNYLYYSGRLFLGVEKSGLRAMVCVNNSPGIEEFHSVFSLWPEVKLTYTFFRF